MKIDSLNPHLVGLLRDGRGSSELDELGLSEGGKLTFEGALLSAKLGVNAYTYHGFPCTCRTCGNDYGAMMMAWGTGTNPTECVYCSTRGEES